MTALLEYLDLLQNKFEFCTFLHSETIFYTSELHYIWDMYVCASLFKLEECFLNPSIIQTHSVSLDPEYIQITESSIHLYTEPWL